MSMDFDFDSLTVIEALKLLNDGECSSRDLVSGLLHVIDERDKQIGAYLSVDAEYAFAMADKADKKRANGGSGRLLGVPIGIKDLINVSGQSCTCGSQILKSYTSPYDATVISQLRAEGAVFLGRMNMDEFAMGSSTENSAYKLTRNPHDRDRVPGGSSGGSAAAVVAGEAFATLGTDTGGSIRQPASFCGCVGLKPSYGRVSRYGLTAFASSLDQIGPLTKDVRDAALILRVIAGCDQMDSTSSELPVPDYTSFLKEDLTGMKLGLPKEYFIDGVAGEVKDTVMAAVGKIEETGAEVVEISLPNTEYAIAVYYVIATAEASANLARFDGVRYGFRAEGARDPIEMYKNTRAGGFGSEVKRRIILGTYVLSSGYYDAYYLKAQKVRTLIRRDFERAFKQCDAILAPVTPTVAFKIGENIDDPLKMYLNDIFSVTSNLAGNCAISVPCGIGAESNLPIGLQIIGAPFKEENILRIGYAFERVD